ncbi:glycosyltransferase family 61 protein [Spirosoma pollinicola]|uniref:glycosyltransferase family 61 protein n=1 Tax=Spirosoma pollinicola TaxID=2057025 RepID=UPI001F0C802F|nr:glycosyltransferase family 61 protein [Spirosoma pollinicola]
MKQIFLPGVQNQAELTTLVFPPCKAITCQSYVWDFRTGTKKTVQLPYGGIVFNGKILCPDFESYHLVKNFLTARTRTVIDRKTVIVPWSHYLDGIAFGGYYDFVILVAAKMCRIKEALRTQVYTEAVVTYPLFKTAYEQEYLSLIGIEPDHVFDSRLYDVRADRCILANSGHWFYPDPADIFALKKQVEPQLNIARTQQNRIYVSRASRRKVVNEGALLALLEKYDFTIVDDKPRSVAEQVAIYKNASFILGPHGASFTNIIWCEPGTHLFELFPPNLVVDHFSYLARIMEMSYSAYSHPIKMGHTKYHIEEDIFVSTADLEKSLDILFEIV